MHLYHSLNGISQNVPLEIPSEDTESLTRCNAKLSIVPGLHLNVPLWAGEYRQHAESQPSCYSRTFLTCSGEGKHTCRIRAYWKTIWPMGYGPSLSLKKEKHSGCSTLQIVPYRFLESLSIHPFNLL